MTFDVADIKKYPIEKLLARAEHVEAIAAKWTRGNPGYADTLRMEVAALRYAAFQLGLDDFQKQREAWPLGCRDANSCARHAACMYLKCRHKNSDIRAAITQQVTQ